MRRSLIKTNESFLYLSVSFGKARIANKTVMYLSPQSPLGSGLVGKKVGDPVLINDKGYIIEKIE